MGHRVETHRQGGHGLREGGAADLPGPSRSLVARAQLLRPHVRAQPCERQHRRRGIEPREDGHDRPAHCLRRAVDRHSKWPSPASDHGMHGRRALRQLRHHVLRGAGVRSPDDHAEPDDEPVDCHVHRLLPLHAHQISRGAGASGRRTGASSGREQRPGEDHDLGRLHHHALGGHTGALVPRPGLLPGGDVLVDGPGVHRVPLRGPDCALDVAPGASRGLPGLLRPVRRHQPLRKARLWPMSPSACRGRQGQCRPETRRWRGQQDLQRQRKWGTAAARVGPTGSEAAEAALLGVVGQDHHHFPLQPRHSPGRGRGELRPGSGDPPREDHGRLHDGPAARHAHVRRVPARGLHVRHRVDQPLQAVA
mmetsp:Transcript_10124/g.32164  ORF Transcript_10124/g.32164 Transcript_10124/m.32164 type:complete len:365 (-) Transcript_10124:1061-2155(-)